MRTLLSKSLPACIALASLALGAPALAHDHSASNRTGMAPLVEKVRTVTARYTDIQAAVKDGWVQATPCVRASCHC